jgi:eukaryotic-like serine/threonine-protein kinase
VDDLDRWTRVRPLGAGAFGEVALAWDQLDSRWVALKRFTGQDELGLLRMVIESRIRVSHPHLVKTLAFRLVDDRAWLVTELARGGSLRGLMTRAGALPWGWVAEAVDQILAALVALHATGVVHRDLKPANLLLRSHGDTPPDLLVGDFGIATWRTVSMTGIGAAIGTPGYLAPEYLDGHQPSPATDVFAVGVLAAELLAGRRMVHYSNASPTMPSTWHDVLPVPAEVPRPLAAVLQRMADPDPTRRYRDANQAREALLSASPPERRTNLTALSVPDLLAELPPGWTPEGPTAPQPLSDQPLAPNLTALPIDGGPTSLVPENKATAEHLATPLPSAQPETPSHGFPATTSPGSPAPPPTPPHGSTPLPPSPAAPPQGSPNSTPPQVSSAQRPAIPPHGSTPPPATPPESPASSPQPPTTPSPHGETPPKHTSPNRKTRRKSLRKKAKQAFLLTILIIFAAGAGTLWWSATHRTIPGAPSSADSPDSSQQPTPWIPIVVAPCSRVEIDSKRANGTERCQRTPALTPPQYWVEAPPGGFPKSNAGGPFPGEKCVAEGDEDYSPVGDHVTCKDGTWQT